MIAEGEWNGKTGVDTFFLKDNARASLQLRADSGPLGGFPGKRHSGSLQKETPGAGEAHRCGGVEDRTSPSCRAPLHPQNRQNPRMGAHRPTHRGSGRGPRSHVGLGEGPWRVPLIHRLPLDDHRGLSPLCGLCSKLESSRRGIGHRPAKGAR